jgi:lambda family phage portal protein
MKLRRECEKVFIADEYAQRALRAKQINVIGPKGIMLQAQFSDSQGNSLDRVNKEIEARWAEFIEAKNFDVAGRLSFKEFTTELLTDLFLKGEFFYRRVYLSSAPHGIQFQRLDSAVIDHELSGDLKDGSRIKNGVIINGWGQHLGYMCLVDGMKDLSGSETINGKKYIRLSSEEARLIFPPNIETGATRGVPLMASSLETLKMVSGYMEAEMIASRLAAAKAGFYVRDKDSTAYKGQVGVKKEKDANGAIVREVQPGEWEALPPGVRVQTYDPQHPNKDFPAFVKTCLRKISAGLGIAYTTLSGDLEGVSYSSARIGVLDERDEFSFWQEFIIEKFCTDVYRDWIAGASLAGIFKTFSAANSKLYTRATWLPRRWSWVDPLKDISAAILELKHGLNSRRRIAAESGVAIEDILSELFQEEELIEEYGLMGILKELIEGGVNNGRPAQGTAGESAAA